MYLFILMEKKGKVIIILSILIVIFIYGKVDRIKKDIKKELII